MNIREVLFWIFLVLSIVFLIWRVFGNTPTELITFITIIFMVVLKLWSVSNRQIKHEMKVKNSFNKMRQDINLIKKKLNA